MLHNHKPAWGLPRSHGTEGDLASHTIYRAYRVRFLNSRSREKCLLIPPLRKSLIFLNIFPFPRLLWALSRFANCFPPVWMAFGTTDNSKAKSYGPLHKNSKHVSFPPNPTTRVPVLSLPSAFWTITTTTIYWALRSFTTWCLLWQKSQIRWYVTDGKWISRTSWYSCDEIPSSAARERKRLLCSQF